MTEIYGSRGGVTNPTDEKARRAVQAFRSMQPMLSAFARVITGKPNVRVVMDPKSNGMTDGKRIFFRPPIELGNNTPHERSLCDQRDANFQQRCPACAVRESVMTTIYHEIGHIAYGTFKESSDSHKSQLLKRAVEENGSKYAAVLEKRIKAIPSWQLDNYMTMAGLISPFLPMLVNNLEDARINSEVFKARKGTRAMFKADVHRIMSQGVPQQDHSLKMWNEYPLNQQIMVGVFLAASGYDVDQWLAPQVVRAINDKQVQALCGEVATLRSVSGIYDLSFKVLARLRQLGFLKNENDPEHEPEEEDETDDEQEPQQAEPQEEGDSDEEDAGGSDSSGDDSGGADSSDPSPESKGEEEDADGQASGGPEPDEEEDVDGGSGDENADSDPDPDADGDGDQGADDAEGSDEASAEGSAGADEEGGDAEASKPSADGTGGESGGPSDASPEEGELSDGDDDSSGEQESSDSVSGAAPEQDGDAQEGDSDSDGSDGGPLGADEPVGEQESDQQDSAGDDTEAGASAGQSDVDMAEGEPHERDGDGSPELANGDDGDDRTGEDDGKPIDTGADEGLGGTELIDGEDDPDLPMGEPEDVTAIHEIAHPEDRPTSLTEQASNAEERAVEVAVVQGMYFESPSRNVGGVREHKSGDTSMDHPAWHGRYSFLSATESGIDSDMDISESILAPALMRMRVAFSDNKRANELRHRKAGKIDARVLGKRAHIGDDRLFKKHIVPGKRDYFVLIGLDVSGSTIGVNIGLIKRAAMAQAMLCHRLGIKFAIYAHSGDTSDGADNRRQSIDLDIYHIKDADEPWTAKVQERLTKLGPDAFNLDGHTLEFYRRVLDTRTETDRIILYYTDGKMPAENHDEELEVLQREIKTCDKKGYTLLGVGIRTDSPTQHGLDTVQVDDDSDLVKVVKHLEKRLLA